MSLQISTSSHDFGSGHSGGSGDLPGGRESRLATMFRQPPIADRPGRPPGDAAYLDPYCGLSGAMGLYRQRLLDRPVAPSRWPKTASGSTRERPLSRPVFQRKTRLDRPPPLPVRVTLPGSLTRSTLRLLNAHGGVFNIFLAPSVTRSLSAILLSPFEFPRSSQRTRGRTGNQEGEVSDPLFSCFALHARTVRVTLRVTRPCPAGGALTFLIYPCGKARMKTRKRGVLERVERESPGGRIWRAGGNGRLGFRRARTGRIGAGHGPSSRAGQRVLGGDLANQRLERVARPQGRMLGTHRGQAQHPGPGQIPGPGVVVPLEPTELDPPRRPGVRIHSPLAHDLHPEGALYGRPRGAAGPLPSHRIHSGATEISAFAAQSIL